MNDEVAKALAILAETEQFLRDEDTRAMQQYLESLVTGPIRSVSAGLASSEAKILMMVQCGTQRPGHGPCLNRIAAIAWTPQGLAWVATGIRPLEGDRDLERDPREEQDRNRDFVEPLVGPWDEPLRAFCWVSDSGKGAHKPKWFTVDRSRVLEMSRRGNFEKPTKATVAQLNGANVGRTNR